MFESYVWWLIWGHPLWSLHRVISYMRRSRQMFSNLTRHSLKKASRKRNRSLGHLRWGSSALVNCLSPQNTIGAEAGLGWDFQSQQLETASASWDYCLFHSLGQILFHWRFPRDRSFECWRNLISIIISITVRLAGLLDRVRAALPGKKNAKGRSGDALSFGRRIALCVSQPARWEILKGRNKPREKIKSSGMRIFHPLGRAS